MKFLGTLAFGFSTIAAMIAALLSFGFHLKVESPVSAQQIAREQQLSQCSVTLNQAEQAVAEAQAKVQGLELRLKEALLVAEQTRSRLAADIAERVNERAALGSSTSVLAGLGVGLWMFPFGFVVGRQRRATPIPTYTTPIPAAMAAPAIAADPARELPVRERVGALPRYEARAVDALPRRGRVV